MIKVVFFIKRGSRRVDRKAPYRRDIPVDLAPGTKGRVYARVHYRRPGNRRVHTRTVSRRFQICGSCLAPRWRRRCPGDCPPGIVRDV